jgi:hypothetical protein
MSSNHEYKPDLTTLFYANHRLKSDQSADPARDQALMDAYNDGGFHWQNATFFKRMPDGAVRLRTFRRLTSDPHSHWTWEDRTIDAKSWASIVCSVSSLARLPHVGTRRGNFMAAAK